MGRFALFHGSVAVRPSYPDLTPSSKGVCRGVGGPLLLKRSHQPLRVRGALRGMIVPDPAGSPGMIWALAVVTFRLFVPPMPHDRLAGWLWPLAVTVLAGILRFWDLGRPRAVVFDETYYTNSFSRLWVAPGADRNATISYNWIHDIWEEADSTPERLAALDAELRACL